MTAQLIEDKEILVTGGGGFIGSRIADTLCDDNSVRVLDRFSTGERSNVPAGATCIRGDIRNEQILDEAMSGVDIVFHEAGIASVVQSVEAPIECHDINTTATLRLLEQARIEDARVILASSVAVYGTPVSTPIDETESYTPVSPYGVSKLAADHYVRLYSELYGVPTVALRYFNVYGPRQSTSEYSGVINTFLNRAQQNKPLQIHGNGTQTRDFVHISDIVQANHRAAVTDHTGRGYNIGTGHSTSIRELAELVIDVTQSDSEITHIESRSGDVQHSRADITAARKHLDYEPTVPIADGLATLAGSPY